jgi:hypothetical protein
MITGKFPGMLHHFKGNYFVNMQIGRMTRYLLMILKKNEAAYIHKLLHWGGKYVGLNKQVFDEAWEFI